MKMEAASKQFLARKARSTFARLKYRGAVPTERDKFNFIVTIKIILGRPLKAI